MTEVGETVSSDTTSGVTGVTVVERLYFVVITLAALFVSYLGFAIPERMDESFTWAELPPLHARFVAALYLFGAVYMGCCALSRYRSQITPGPPAVVVFTSLLLLVTLLNLEAFDFDLGPPWAWTSAYVVYPLLGLAIIVWTKDKVGVAVPGPALPSPAQRFMQVQAVGYGVAGVLLLVARELMVDVWPWPITNGLAQFYGGPFLAIAYCCWRYSTRREVLAVSPIAVGLLAFATATVAVSLRHRELFSASDAATWLWFGWFAATAVGWAWLTAQVAAASRREAATAPA